MPLTGVEYEWEETPFAVFITLQLRTATTANTDVYCSDVHVRINHAPFVQDLDLREAVDEDQSVASIGNGTVKLKLIKKMTGIWGSLLVDETDRAKLIERRQGALERKQAREKQKIEDAKMEKRKAESAAVDEQLRVDEERRREVERRKEEEKKRAADDLQEWAQRLPEQSKEAQRDAEEGRVAAAPAAAAPQSTSIFPDTATKPSGKVIPPPRSGGKVEITFTDKYLPAPARESKAAEEEALRQYWQSKQANPDAENIMEQNPLVMKDKGDAFFKSGDYGAAVSAYTVGIHINDTVPMLFSNRAAAYMKLEKYEDCVRDCSKAIDILRAPPAPKVADTTATVQRDGKTTVVEPVPVGVITEAEQRSIIKLLVRRGGALFHMGQTQRAITDYEEALRMDPTNEAALHDLATIKTENK